MIYSKKGDIDVSDADVELRVKMLNINYGKNKKLLELCRPLHEYSWLINKVRQHIKTLKKLEKAFDVALDEMPIDFVIRKFLFKHKAEVKGMFLTEYNEEKLRQFEREEGREEGREEEKVRVVTDMLKKNFPISLIGEISQLSENVILGLAEKLGISAVLN